MTSANGDPPISDDGPDRSSGETRALTTFPENTTKWAATSPGARISGRAALLIGAAIAAAVVVTGVLLAKRQLGQAPPIRVENIAPTTEEKTLDLPASIEAPAHAVESPSPEKIFNATNDQIKAGADAIAQAGEQTPGAITELPPPPDDFGGAGLQDAAKDAAKLLKPEADAIDLSSQDPQASISRLERAAEFASPEAALTLEVASLAGNLDAERRRADEQSAEIARLNAELRRLKADGAPDSRHAQAAIALAALAQQARSGGAYRAEYDAYRRMAPESPALRPLAARADAGLPTIAVLMKNFAGPRNDALDIARRTAAKGPLARLGASVAALVDLRPAHPIEGADAAAVLSRAESRLEAGDLAGAVAEIDALRGAEAALLASWIAEARARLDAEAALQAEVGRTYSLGPQEGAER